MSTRARQLELRGTLTSADMHQTRPIFVDVPEGVTDIHFTFAHTPHFAPDQKLPHQISVMIFDTNGPRFEISRPDDAGIIDQHTYARHPAASAGPIPAGRWMVFILVFRLLSEDAGRVSADGRYVVRRRRGGSRDLARTRDRWPWTGLVSRRSPRPHHSLGRLAGTFRTSWHSGKTRAWTS